LEDDDTAEAVAGILLAGANPSRRAAWVGRTPSNDDRRRDE
jgi:hypothetical protein